MLWLGAGVLLFFAVLGALQAFNTSQVSFLNPETAGETLAFTGLTVVVFLLLLVLLLLLLRNILKVYADQGSSALGARLRTRMVLGAVLIALTPAVFMFLFSFQLMNRSIDRWFSPNTTELHEDSTRVVLELAQYVTNNARVEAESIAASSEASPDAAALNRLLSAHRITLTGGFVMAYDRKQRLIANYKAPPEQSPATLLTWLNGEERGTAVPLSGPLSTVVLSTAQHTGQPVLRVSEQEYALGMATTAGGKLRVVVALPMPEGLSQTTARIRSGADEYWRLFRSRRQVRDTFILMLMLITVVVFFSSVWLALFLSKQITRPVEALAEAMDEIAAGKYDHRVQLMSSGEMGELIESFNHMAGDLEASRQMAERSAAQLSAAHQANEARRRELETIVETIPSGVATLDGAGTILEANRAFGVLLCGDDAGLQGKKLESLLPAESVEDFARVIRRGRRMGAASTEMEVHAGGRTMHLAVASARLELGDGQAGTVLVVEDTSELLRAQRQVAWKEVAQRVAHEIKNPLTPIALSAERIGRHLDRGQPDSPSVIRKCSEVILGCVTTLHTLVDQFSALAQFPAPQPRACDLNEVADEALALFAGRLEGITVRRALEEGLPQVMADPEGMRRALANLIDNAAEAMQGSLLRVLSVTSSLSEDGGALEVTVGDTGHGLTDEIRERLFLPFYSTKRRGTGLGLSIAAKIVQEHGGSIRAESNSPKGARFVVRLPLMEQTVSAGPEDGAPAPVSGART
ncbi:MAG: ATP-binding protein [Terracidiphilus sp.]